MCWKCLATKGLSAASLHLAYTNVNDNAPWCATEGAVPWRLSPAYAMLDGFHAGYIHADILHCWHLGTGRDLVASAVVFLIRNRLCFQGGTITERLQNATEDLRSFCKRSNLPLKLHKLSKSKLNWQTKCMPELRSSGYDTFVVGKWLCDVASRFSALLPEDLFVALWSSDHILSLLSNGGRYLTDLEQRNKRRFGAVFMRAYVRLANESIRARTRLYRLRPKCHVWHHILKDAPRSGLNPHVYSTWMDEDMLRKIMKVHKHTFVKTSPLRVLQRYLMGIAGIWIRKDGRL